MDIQALASALAPDVCHHLAVVKDDNISRWCHTYLSLSIYIYTCIVLVSVLVLSDWLQH